MKRVLFLIVFVSLCFFVLNHPVYALGTTKDFSGQIIATKAIQIDALEKGNYTCVVPGKTIQIKSVGVTRYQPGAYFIPFNSLARWRSNLKIGKQILGQYSGKFSIVCTSKTVPPTVQTVMLPIVGMHGTPSK